MSRFKKLTILFTSAVLFGGGAILFGGVGATTATAGTYATGSPAVGLSFPGGPGHPGPVWAGTWQNGQKGFCIDFGEGTPNRKGSRVINGPIPGMTAEASRQAMLIANKYDKNGSSQTTANAGIAIWRLQHDSAFNKWYGFARKAGVITTAREDAINAIINDARQHAPYNMHVTADKVLFGQSAKGTVKVFGSNGKPAVGRSVTVTATGAHILTVNGVKSHKGIVRSTFVAFTYQRTATAKVTFKATLASDSSTKARVSVSSAGHQRTLSGGFTETEAKPFDYETTVNGPEITQECATNCDGVSKVTFTFNNPAKAQNITWEERIGSDRVQFSARPGATGTSKPAYFADGKVITSSSYCYTGSVFGGKCTTPWVTQKIKREIVCPAWAKGELELPCNCTPDLPGSVTMTSPAGSTRFYRGFVSLDKGADTPIDLGNGISKTISTGKLVAGTNVVISFKVYKDAARKVEISADDGTSLHVLREIHVVL